jgi:hypothetical protein
MVQMVEPSSNPLEQKEKKKSQLSMTVLIEEFS